MNDNNLKVQPNGTAGEFRSDSKSETFQFTETEFAKVEQTTGNKIEKQNTRTIMQALCGCQKNCRECREDESEWDPKIEQKEANRG